MANVQQLHACIDFQHDLLLLGTREEDLTHDETQQVQRRAHFVDEDDIDGHHIDDETDGNKAVDSRGLTLKTTTGTGKY
jgi:hypothetical protein